MAEIAAGAEGLISDCMWTNHRIASRAAGEIGACLSRPLLLLFPRVVTSLPPPLSPYSSSERHPSRSSAMYSFLLPSHGPLMLKVTPMHYLDPVGRGWACHWESWDGEDGCWTPGWLVGGRWGINPKVSRLLYTLDVCTVVRTRILLQCSSLLRAGERITSRNPAP